MDLRNGDCLEVMKELEKDSVDLMFADLPYCQISAKWDVAIDLELFWKEVNRVCKPDAPMIFTCSVKFGNTLINSNPKNFRYDLIWVKSAPCGFLNAKKMPMKKHEMVYVFYNKLPKVYTENIALHHKHKFLKDEKKVIKETNHENAYNAEKRKKPIVRSKPNQYEPPLPNSVIKEENVVDEDYDNRVIKSRNTIKKEENYGKEYLDKKINFRKYNKKLGGKGEESHLYEPPLPNSILEMKSEKGKHATQKPVALMEWILKYYSREGGVVLDPTMGSGSMGVACKNQNRLFIGVEKDETIYKVALDRCGL
jgi:site-specific DNA-methyltransferase (adenine-specific)